MDKKDITSSYWGVVWVEVKKTAWKEADMRGHLIGLIGILLYGLVFSLLYITKTISITLFNNVIGNVTFEATTICIPIAVFVILLIISLAQVPAKLDTEKTNEITVLKEKISLKEYHDIDISFFDYPHWLTTK